MGKLQEKERGRVNLQVTPIAITNNRSTRGLNLGRGNRVIFGMEAIHVILGVFELLDFLNLPHHCKEESTHELDNCLFKFIGFGMHSIDLM